MWYLILFFCWWDYDQTNQCPSVKKSGCSRSLGSPFPTLAICTDSQIIGLDPLPHFISLHTKSSKIQLTMNSSYVRLQCAVTVPLISYDISQLKPFIKYFLGALPVCATCTQHISSLTWENQKSGNYSISVLYFNFCPIKIKKKNVPCTFFYLYDTATAVTSSRDTTQAQHTHLLHRVFQLCLSPAVWARVFMSPSAADRRWWWDEIPLLTSSSTSDHFCLFLNLFPLSLWLI